MKKNFALSALALALILSACSTKSAEPTPLPPTPTEEDLRVVYSEAECTATSQEQIDYYLPGDWVTGAVEGYATTLIEYGDFQ